jgi:mycothiol synthase
LSAAIARAQEKGTRQIVSGARATQKAGQEFLKANHFVAVGNNRFMKAPANTPIEAPRWPKGFVLRTFAELGDVAALVAGSNGCYTDMWGHRENVEPASMAHFQENMTKSPDYYVAEGIFVLFAPDGEVAGICFNRLDREAQQKVIDSPGIVPAYRHLGLHRALVQASMHWLDTQAEGMFHLDTWGDFAEAVQIYEELGFRLDEANHLLEYLLKT